MKKELTAEVGADGVLNLTVQLGREEANKTVRVVVETLEQTASPPRSFADQAEWLRFLDETGGRWQGDFSREPQGDYEERHPL